MKNSLIVLNWKARKTTTEAKEWLDAVSSASFSSEYFYVLAVPYTLLSFCSDYVVKQGLPFLISSQDVSSLASGSYTGETPAELIKEFALYTLIGHSERRQHLSESSEVLEKKVRMALSHALTPLFCVQSATTPIPEGVSVVGYEPIGAIGTGQTERLSETEAVAQKIKETHPEVSVLYGGSADSENIMSYLASPHLSGVLVGTASVEIETTLSLLEAIQ